MKEMTDLDLFRATGEALLGPLWQSELARQLNVSLRTMQRWAAGEFAIPPGVWVDLLKLLADRQDELAKLRPLLQKQVASTSD